VNDTTRQKVAATQAADRQTTPPSQVQGPRQADVRRPQHPLQDGRPHAGRRVWWERGGPPAGPQGGADRRRRHHRTHERPVQTGDGHQLYIHNRPGNRPSHEDRWDAGGVTFLFGIDASPALRAEHVAEVEYRPTTQLVLEANGRCGSWRRWSACRARSSSPGGG